MHVVVISGGGTGIGLASVRYFARRNAQVVIIGRRGAVLNEAVQAVRREFPEAPEVLALPGDLAAPGQVESICKDLSERFPIVDWLAGFARGRARDRASYSGQRRCRARPLIGSQGVSAASYRYQCAEQVPQLARPERRQIFRWLRKEADFQLRLICPEIDSPEVGSRAAILPGPSIERPRADRPG